MTAAQSIKTPVMTLPIRRGCGHPQAVELANRLRRIRFAEVKSHFLAACFVTISFGRDLVLMKISVFSLLRTVSGTQYRIWSNLPCKTLGKTQGCTDHKAVTPINRLVAEHQCSGSVATFFCFTLLQVLQGLRMEEHVAVFCSLNFCSVPNFCSVHSICSVVTCPAPCCCRCCKG